MDKPGIVAATNSAGEPLSAPVGTSSKVEVSQKEKVHGKDALKKIKDINPALYEILSKAYVPEN